MSPINKTKHIPKPFQRPGITLSTGSDRTWQKLAPADVRSGDIVQGRNRGLVVSKAEGQHHIVLAYQNGTAENFSGTESLDVFTEPRNG